MVKRDKLGRFTKECVGKENPFYRKSHKKKTKVEHGKVMKEKWKNPEFRENQIKKSKGQRRSPKTEFKKGHIPKNPFKKGNIPWCKGLKGVIKSWNIGLTKETDERVRKSGEKNKLNLDEKEIIRLYKKEKLSSRKIAKKLNCSPIVIIRILKENNIKIYPTGFFHKGKSWGHHTEKARKKMSEDNPSKRPEVREKLKKARAKQILPVKDTSIEVKIQNFLKTLGVEFFTHQYMKIEHGYQCDILIPYLNLVIECDGDYWHKYPVGNDIDHVRTKELIEKGFNVLRLWEFEIKEMSIKEFKNKIEKFK